MYNDSCCDSSCDSSCCDYHSDDSIPEWSDAVLENGELFYIKCSPLINDSSTNDVNVRSTELFSKRNKLSKFLKKQKSKKCKTLGIKNQVHEEGSRFDAKTECRTSSLTETEVHSAAVLYITLVSTEQDDSTASDNVIYCFPQAIDKNVIYSIRGALLTLYHLLPKLVTEVPESSLLSVNDELIHVVYRGAGKELLIVALPESKSSLFELKQLSSCIVRYLNFRYKSLSECFKKPVHHANLNQFFGNLFIKMIQNTITQPVALKRSISHLENHSYVQFEDTFGFPRKLIVPFNMETKIEEKLNEIEANDFGELSDDHCGYQRLYTITGSCLYYKGYLIASHLDKDDQLDVHAFLRLNDLLDLTVTSAIESLVIWQEVFMTSCSYCIEGSRTFLSNKRWFLLIIGQDQSLLAILLESGGCSVRLDGISKPDELYIEQIQDSLDDILHYGLADVIDSLMKTSEAPSLQNNSLKSSENLLNILNSNTSTLTKSSSTLSCESDTHLHHSSPTFMNGNFDDTYSDTLSRTASSIFSDEAAPVLGRRAQRMKQLSNSGSIYPLHSNLSDSDRSDLDTTGSSHSSSFADVGKKSLKEVTPARKIIHGDGQALYHYVNLHSSRGVIVCSLNSLNAESNSRYRSILNNFRLSAQKIHRVLSQKKISNIGRHHRNSIPVKEFGLLFDYEDDEKDKKTTATYWVVGRAFNKGHLGEVYICYEDNTPQNLVEIAFRLAMST